MTLNDRESSKVDIFQLLVEADEKEKKKMRGELLKQLGVLDFFVDGNISINKKTCEGIECRLCIDVCPTNALYWKPGEIEVSEDLCVYCGACVLSCIVDDCIKIKRKRQSGEIEIFSKPREFIVLQHCISTRKRSERILNNLTYLCSAIRFE